MSTCRTCKYAAHDEGDAETGWCHRPPPSFIPPASSAWPPVSLDRGWCGEYSRAWWRSLKSLLNPNPKGPRP